MRELFLLQKQFVYEIIALLHLGISFYDGIHAVSYTHLSARTAEYYKSRPCAAKVESAARLFAEYLMEKK